MSAVQLSDEMVGVVVGAGITVLAGAMGSVVMYLGVMFQDEIKAWLKGRPERRREKKFNLAMAGNRRARKWCKKNLTEEWRERKYEPLHQSRDFERFSHVMWAIDPEISLDEPGASYVTKPYDPEADAAHERRVEKLREKIEADQRRRHGTNE